MTPPDFTNEISKYQFHTRYTVPSLPGGCAPGPRWRRALDDRLPCSGTLDRHAENPKLEQNELYTVQTRVRERFNVIMILKPDPTFTDTL